MMRARGGSRVCAVLLWLAAAGAAAGEPVSVPPELWDRPRSAGAVLGQPALRGALRAWLARPGARLVIHHGYGQAPQEQAEELRAWLMALAVDGARIGLAADLKAGDSLKIEVLP